jgi:ABC-type nitrate/sulfonate/bicarbonate transport system substrate-binding protein
MTSLSFRDYQNAQTSLANAAPAVPFSAPGEVFSARFKSGLLLGTMGETIARHEAVSSFADWYEAQTGTPYDQQAQIAQAEIAATIPEAARHTVCPSRGGRSGRQPHP